ncbi:MAG: substrate-binding domain-containing protein [Moheibacter sp.]
MSHSEGEMTIYADPSNQSLLQALTEIYMMKFPKVKFDIIYKPENQILKDLIDTTAYAAFINQPLTEAQTEFIRQKTDVTPRSTLLAYDAVVFVTSPENPIDSVTFDMLRAGIMTEDGKVIFDNGNSGNFNTVKEVLGLEIQKGKSIQAVENSEEVIGYIQRSKNSIGVIGLNEISEPDSKKAKEILSKVKVLPVIDHNNQLQQPTVPNILALKYPFFKGVYFIVREAGFGIGSGFSRFAGSQQGQLIVGREGLQPNYLYPREVQVNLKPIQ